MTYKKQVGDYGENLVADLLRAKGYEIIARNYRKFFGEIDIVARNEELVAFVEVKTRKNKDFANPSEAVTFSKQAKIVKASQAYLMENDLTDSIIRFDVAEVIRESGEVNYIENAF
ncbi:YraN family protein [uncultured Anaerococcus sp.]|uniref:YraN family protein n=1 Tax=uncultured Anaerococcus sp. TaxID=293428 RepID=UPI00263A104B|nr:YraN family protein [uncultured Anaerococcus sp.]